MQVNGRNVNFQVSNNPHVSGVEVNRQLKKESYFIRAWNRNKAIRDALEEFRWEHLYERVRIVDIRVELISEGGGYEPNYYKVTIIYTKEKNDLDLGSSESILL
jgi:hypothetical protein